MAGAGGFGSELGDEAKSQGESQVASGAQSVPGRADDGGGAPSPEPPGKGKDPGGGAEAGASQLPDLSPGGPAKQAVTGGSPAAAAMGAGGTSEAAKGPIEGLPPMPGGGKAGKAAAAGAAAAPAAAQLTILMMFLQWLKFMFQMAAAIAANLWSMFLGALVAVAKAVAGFFMGIGGAISGAVGGALSAVGGAVVSGLSFLAAGALVVGGAVGIVQSNEIYRHEAAPQDCSAVVQQAVSQTGDGTVDSSAQTLANAKTVYSVLSAWGMSDENVAGILGNWSMESGIDPTGVEGIYDEPFQIGTKKKAAQEANFGGFTNYLGNTMDVRGLGLGQWTNGRGQALLDYSSSIGKDWFALETQLGFMISAGEGSNADVVKGMIATSQDSPGAAAVYFHDEWERSADSSTQARQDAASSWYAQMGGWAKNASLANSILAQAGTALDNADAQAVNSALSACVGQKLDVDNSTLATAITSYAWPFYDDSKGNDGTYLYVWLHEQIFPGDPYFASCDRSVATAVRWSGSDDTFPAGAVQQQINYVSTSDKWESLDWGGDKANLQPGDVLIRKDSEVSHIVMYIGPDVPLQVWGEGNYTPNTEIASGSLNDRSPALGQWYGASSGHGTSSGGGTGLDTYTAWRLVKPDNSTEFSSLVPDSSAKAGDGDKTRMTTPG